MDKSIELVNYLDNNYEDLSISQMTKHIKVIVDQLETIEFRYDASDLRIALSQKLIKYILNNKIQNIKYKDIPDYLTYIKSVLEFIK